MKKSGLAIGSGRFVGGGLLIAAVIIVATAGYTYYRAAVRGDFPFFPSANTGEIYVNGERLGVWIASTPEARQAGLTGYDSIPRNAGMLFVFGQDGRYPVSAQSMHFPIDIVWIDGAGSVTDVLQNVQPGDQAQYPAHPGRYVLEVNAGAVDSYGIQPGDTIDLSGAGLGGSR